MHRRPHSSEFKQRRLRAKRTIRTLLSAEQLNQAIVRESARVDRKGNEGALSVVLFRVPTNGRKPSVYSIVRLAKAVLKRIRVTDDLGWFDRLHLGLVLPDTSVTGAWRLAQEVCDIVEKRSGGARPLVTMYTYPAAQGEGTAEAPGTMRSDEKIVALPGHRVEIGDPLPANAVSESETRAAVKVAS